MKTYLIVNIDRCWGCRSCLTACKREHGHAPDAPDAIDVARLEGTDEQDRIQCDFLPLMCLHCDHPACVAACPTGAIKKADNGHVLLDEDLCVGCGKCEKVCPYGAVAVDAARRKALKCDLCRERCARGLIPSCVQHCMGHALSLVSQEELQQHTDGLHVWSCGQVIYTSEKLSALGQALEPAAH